MDKQVGDPLAGLLAAEKAIKELRISGVLFRWVAHVLGIEPKRFGTLRLYDVQDVTRIDAYMKKFDPAGNFRVRAGGRSPQRAASNSATG